MDSLKVSAKGAGKSTAKSGCATCRPSRRRRRAGRGREGVGEVGRKRGCFGLWHSQERQKRPLPPVLEAPNSENSTDPCLEKCLGVRYQWMAKSKEIPGQRFKSEIPGKFRRREVSAPQCVSRRHDAYNRQRRKGQAHAVREHSGGELHDGLF